MKHLGASAVVLSAVLGAACGSVATAESGASASGRGAGGAFTSSTATAASSAGAGGVFTSSTATAPSSTSSMGGSGQACGAAIEAIAAASTGSGSCTGVVRLDYTSMTILGFQVVCGPYAKPTEASARAAAEMQTGNGTQGASIAGAAPADEFVFWQAPSDFGWGAAVSARSGVSVFGGTVVWDGAGDITYPKTWKPAAALGLGCGPPMGIPVPKARAFDLGGGQPLSSAQVGAALERVWSTAMPAGMAEVGYLFDAMVLLYPRSVGLQDPQTAEWIVLVNAGYLE